MVQAGLCDEIIDLHAMLAVCSDISTQYYNSFPLFPSRSWHDQDRSLGLYGVSSRAGRLCLWLPHTPSATRLQPANMLAVAPVTSPIAAFAWSPSSPDPMTGMQVVPVALGNSSHPVQTSHDQVYLDMLTFCIARHIYRRISHLRPNKSHPFRCVSHHFAFIMAKKWYVCYQRTVGSVK